MVNESKGSFTIPGESGCEELTLKMAEKWGADVIRDSDGTELSDKILDTGYGIYSTICIIRDHNEWAKKHPDKLQQTFLMSNPVMAQEEILAIHIMNGYFKEQFRVNDSKEAMKYWQVYDRTTDELIPSSKWRYLPELGNVIIQNIKPFHTYTVSFLAYQIWEEISMYNHITNNWEKEHLMPVDPRYKETQMYLYQWLEKWCKSHPATTVVRFTSMFYNFTWIWGSSEKNRSLYSDWGSYDFSVSPKALDEFKKEYGYGLTAEDFINQGKLHVTHMPAGKHQLDYMQFTNRFVVEYGKKLVELVHKYNKKAYVFYDDSWIGVEPYSSLFPEFKFDGLIKCVFSGYEARLCAGADVETHELRLHPYLFPVGLGGAPTFSGDGDPTTEAKKYWKSIRRALLREPVDRIGLGGYLHLVENYPDFCDYIEEVSNEFRKIKEMHALEQKENGTVYTLPIKVAILHSWGSIRSWSLSGHFHETYMHDLIHINEALAGLPVDVSFISFEDVKQGVLKDCDIVINAGRAQTAWSGGDHWKDEEVVRLLYQFVYQGGALIGVNEPSAVRGYSDYFRMAKVLGVDEDTGEKVCHGRWEFETKTIDGLLPEGYSIKSKENRYLTDGKATVLASDETGVQITVNEFGKGKGIYLSSFQLSNANTRLLLNLMLYAKGMKLTQDYLTDNVDTECAYYPSGKKLAVINNSEKVQTTTISIKNGEKKVELQPYETQIIDL
ncbi:MAG: 1,3-beta-galactosyl-N-acetylhexosamine phosphorylase [bacterium]|nr:1,3-beta-galactosyl-N-acetylhexosamine phosphorylase [bacterium]